MGSKLAHIPYEELIEDKAASKADIEVCMMALLHGVTSYGNGESTQHRLDVNEAIVKAIDEELNLRALAESMAE